MSRVFINNFWLKEHVPCHRVDYAFSGFFQSHGVFPSLIFRLTLWDIVFFLMHTLLSYLSFGNSIKFRSHIVLNAYWATPAMRLVSALVFRRAIILRSHQSLTFGVLIWYWQNVLIWHRIMSVFIRLDLCWEGIAGLLILSRLSSFLLLFRFISLHARVGPKRSWIWTTTLSARSSIVIVVFKAFSQWTHIYWYCSLFFSQQTFFGLLAIFFLWLGALLIKILLGVYLS